MKAFILLLFLYASVLSCQNPIIPATDQRDRYTRTYTGVLSGTPFGKTKIQASILVSKDSVSPTLTIQLQKQRLKCSLTDKYHLSVRPVNMELHDTLYSMDGQGSFNYNTIDFQLTGIKAGSTTSAIVHFYGTR